jgi:hypothetical protein
MVCTFSQEQIMLRYVIVLATAAMTMGIISIHGVEAAGMSQIDAINACRAELGKQAKYLDVRKCVIRKMKGE